MTPELTARVCNRRAAHAPGRLDPAPVRPVAALLLVLCLAIGIGRASEFEHDRSASPRRLPGATTEEWIAPSVAVGRSEVQVSRFTDPRPPQSVMTDVVDAWKQRPAPLQQLIEGSWHVVVQAEDGWVETVRLRADDRGTSGLRIRQRLAAPAVAAATSAIASLLPQSRIVNRTEQQADGRAVASWVITSALDPVTFLAHLDAVARERGFGQVIESTSRTAPTLWLRRRADELLATVAARDGGSVAVVHWSRSRRGPDELK
jgi:hypothetical protein